MKITSELTQQQRPFPAESQLGFGKYFADHIFATDYSKGEGWHSARIMPYQNLKLDPGASALHYGQTLFEGLKAFRGDDGKIRLFRPQMNWERMQAGADRLCMQAPPLELFLEGLVKLVQTDREWVPSTAGTSLYIRPTLIGTEAFLGVRPADNFLFYIMTSPVGYYYGSKPEPVSIWIESKFSRAAHGGIGAVKAGGNYASSLRAGIDAKKRGYSQVLWLDSSEHRFVEEVGTMNVFFVIKDQVITPKLNGSILPGVMRDSVIHYLNSIGRKVEERPIEVNEILSAIREGTLSEAFGTGTAASIAPISAFGTEIGSKAESGEFNRVQILEPGTFSGPLSSQLMKFFSELQYGRRKDDFAWLVDID
jgi:branched-chain amino acid aminotransferase